MRNALIIFVRKPELGKVKTRLAASIGPEKTLAIYLKLLQHTKDTITPVACDKYIFMTELHNDILWSNFFMEQQKGENLGSRMQNAFTLLFEKGYNKLVIIGSDCPGLSIQHIESAFSSLDNHHLVIGPAADGGYYLLGLTEIYPQLFQNKMWSTDTVYGDTLNDIKQLGLHHVTLPVLNDVDEIKDVPAEWL